MTLLSSEMQKEKVRRKRDGCGKMNHAVICNPRHFRVAIYLTGPSRKLLLGDEDDSEGAFVPIIRLRALTIFNT